MKKKFLFSSSFALVFILDSCNLPPHYTKKKMLEEDSAQIASNQNAEADINYSSFTPEFSKLDKNILMPLFHGDSIDRNGNVYWTPTIDEMIEQIAHPLPCTTNIEKIYYFNEQKTKWAFVLFVTFDEYANQGAHSSAPIIGGATFRSGKDKKWTLENIDKAITRHGEMGYLKPFNFVKCGKDKHALQLSHSYSGTGQTTESDYFYDLKELKEIFAFETGGSYDDGDETSGLSYSFSSEILFDDPNISEHDWYDLIVKMKGTKRRGRDQGLQIIDTVIIYRFNTLRHIYEPVCDY
jgi:hypothetical protein